MVVDCRVTPADGYGEREAAKTMAADLGGLVFLDRPIVDL